jgi:signal transduction histidine kinase
MTAADRPARILIVDDERHNRTLLEVMLEPEGFVLSLATSGEEALVMVAKDPPDLVIMDVLMPGMTGYDVVGTLKGNVTTKHIPIIMVTALDDRDARIVGLSAGAEDFLTRPLDRAELCMRVRNLLRLKTASDGALAGRDNSMGMVSHDLRNLLHGIVLQTTMLADDASASTDNKEMVVGLKRILGFAGRMHRLVEDLVDVVSIDAGKLALEPARHVAATLLSEIVDASRLAAAEKGISIRSDTVDPSLMATFDRERILQVMNNLVTNAIKFTPRGGAIMLRCEGTDDGLVLSVSDTGVGIPGKLLDTVFERFVQVTHDHRGLGLGLYISQCIVQSHAGRMWVESTVGKGSTFYFTIPFMMTKPKLVPTSTASPP